MNTDREMHIVRTEPGTAGAPARAPWRVAIPRLPTGILGLDLALEGGLPLGSIASLTGSGGHCGKTTLALTILGQAQAAGLDATYICGATMPPEDYFRACGVRLDDLTVPAPADVAHLEAALNYALRQLAMGSRVVVLDPLPAFPTTTELDDGAVETGAYKWNLNRALDSAYRIASSYLRTADNGLLVVVDQQRERPGVLFGSPWEDVGAEVIKHFPVHLDLQRVEAIKRDGITIGSRIRVRVKKNGGGTPFVQIEFDILHHEGPDFWGSVLDVALACGAVTKRQHNQYFLGEQFLGQGRDAARAALAGDPMSLCHELPEPARVLLEPACGAVSAPVSPGTEES